MKKWGRRRQKSGSNEVEESHGGESSNDDSAPKISSPSAMRRLLKQRRSTPAADSTTATAAVASKALQAACAESNGNAVEGATAITTKEHPTDDLAAGFDVPLPLTPSVKDSLPPAESAPETSNNNSATTAVAPTAEISTEIGDKSKAPVSQPPDLSNLWSRQYTGIPRRGVQTELFSGSSSENINRRRKQHYPTVRDYVLRVPPTEALMSRRFAFQSRDGSSSGGGTGDSSGGESSTPSVPPVTAQATTTVTAAALPVVRPGAQAVPGILGNGTTTTLQAVPGIWSKDAADSGGTKKSSETSRNSTATATDAPENGDYHVNPPAPPTEVEESDSVVPLPPSDALVSQLASNPSERGLSSSVSEASPLSIPSISPPPPSIPAWGKPRSAQRRLTADDRDTLADQFRLAAVEAAQDAAAASSVVPPPVTAPPPMSGATTTSTDTAMPPLTTPIHGTTTTIVTPTVAVVKETATVPPVRSATVTTATTTFTNSTDEPTWGKTSASLLDDDDDDDGDDHTNHAGKRKLESTIMSEHEKNNISNDNETNLLTVPPTSLRTLSANGSDKVSPPVWGRKAQKSTLEEDAPDGREVAFAESSAAVGIRPVSPSRPQQEKQQHQPPMPPPGPIAKISSPARSTNAAPFANENGGEPNTGGMASTNGIETIEERKPTNAEQGEDNDAKEMTEEEQLRAAIAASKNEPEPSAHRESQRERVFINQEEMEDAKENARSLRTFVSSNGLDMEFLKTLLDMCRADQRKMSLAVEDCMNGATEDDQAPGAFSLEELIDMNINISDAITEAEKLNGSDSKSSCKAAGHAAITVKYDLDLFDLVDKRDIFSLICMLRVQQHDKRLAAAHALMSFARDAQLSSETATPSRHKLATRDEIRSSGGLHTLITLFRSHGNLYELKVVTALAVAYVLPSFMESSSQTPPTLGLKIIECLHFLVTANEINYNNEVITPDEMFNASAMALTNFWVNHLEPMLTKSPQAQDYTLTESVSFARQRNRGINEHRYEAVAVDELLGTTVLLIMAVAKHEALQCEAMGNTSSDGCQCYKWSTTLVEQVCAVEVARPIAVREGILQVLVSWIRSKDRHRIGPAASALRYVTSINDKYMAGWIHSEMVNKGAVQGLADLTRDISVTRDVRLAIAQILSSLCTAPHTRAAVVESNCINFLIGILYEHNDPTSEEVALFAGSAILQLAAGAITRAAVFNGDVMDSGDVVRFATPDKSDSLIGDIVASGAISSFVAIAQDKKGKLRSVAVRALRVISEDVSPKRRTRLQLCEDSASLALGSALKNYVDILKIPLAADAMDGTPETCTSLADLQEALCALANILDPDQDSVTTPHTLRAVSSSSFKDPQHFLIKGCLETANSGGLASLLQIASLPFNKNTSKMKMELHEEACRSLASMAPLLLTKKVAVAGYSKWANDVLNSLHHTLKQLSSFDVKDDLSSQAVELLVNVLQGIACLARSKPLKVRIIDVSLPYLLQAKNIRDQPDVSNAAGQAFLSLELAEGEVAAQVAGNSPSIFAEWFCLKRSLLIQSMAREEVSQYLCRLWDIPFEESRSSISLTRESSRDCSFIYGSALHDSETALMDMAEEVDDTKIRNDLISEYRDVFGEKYNQGTLLPEISSEDDEFKSLLAKQMYPLNSSVTEAMWILDHRKAMLVQKNSPSSSLSGHVEKLLHICFPSKLLRDTIIPVDVLRPDSYLNFRALMMTERRYFSFRREGQLLSSLCDVEAASLASSSVHWTLGFINSSFAGEFAESLVQMLYKCPMIEGLSFVRNAGWIMSEEEKKDTNCESSGAVLSNLVGSLPPWISHLTFEGFFEEADLKNLAFILESMGKLSAGNQGSSEQSRKISFLAIRRTPYISPQIWIPFFELLGGKSVLSRGPSTNPLQTLKALDLSGNKLGDDLCAAVLEVIHDEGSICMLEELDLSGNKILSGNRVLRILRAYASRRLSHENNKIPLHTLNLASNDLRVGQMWIELINLLNGDGLSLKVLDLSGNDLSLDDGAHQFISTLVHTLARSDSLELLNLSKNSFSSQFVEQFLTMLKGKESGTALISFSNNLPDLTPVQQQSLDSFSAETRQRVLKRHMEQDAEQENNDSYVRTSSIARRLHSNASIKTLPAEAELFEESTLQESNSKSHQKATVESVDNVITVLFSAPLVFTDGRTVRPFAKLDFQMERELMWQCLKEASRDIGLSFDSATHDRLLATMAKRCSCLHYSGHGHEQYLPFEDGSGGPYWFKVDQFKSLIEKEGGAPFRFVFVSACYSYLAGETFASAGVPHVVCCQQESELKDTAALAFTRQFYLNLAIGHTVKESFDQGCKAVRATPNLKNPDVEMKKFLLLPANGNHDVPIFNAKEVTDWPKGLTGGKQRNSSRPMTRTSLKSRNMLGGARSSELSVRNMMQEDPSPSPPEFFLGREVDMYYVLKAVLSKRLVSVIGDSGMGRSSLVCALCHYINERATTIMSIDRIYYVKARQRRKRNAFRYLIQRLIKKLVEEDTLKPVDPEADMETLFDTICEGLKHERVLIVFDRAEVAIGADNSNEFPMLLSKLCRETKNVKVLLTNHNDLGIPSLGEHPISLGPLNFGDTVRLFANLCPYLHTPADRKKLFENVIKDGEEAELLSTDPGMGEATKGVFALLGGGIPSQIEKSAFDLSKEDFLRLYKGTHK